MRRTNAAVLLAWAWVAAGCAECARQGCVATEQPAGGASIKQGIVGAASDESHMCVEDCCECPFASAALTVLATDEPVLDAESAEALLTSDAERQEIAIASRYQHELSPGDYLACIQSHYSGTWSACAPFVVESARVTTVHAQLAGGPGRVGVYTPDGGEAGPSFAVFKEE